MLLWIAVILCSVFWVSTAASADAQTVRVGYPIQPGLTDIDENGNYDGYTYEYLEEIAQYTGWDYEFVQVSGDEDESITVLLDMLARGEIDFMGGMLYTESAGEAFQYSGQSYGTVETVLQTIPENVSRVYINSQEPQTLRIAVASMTGRTIEELENYCQMNLVMPEYVLCADEEAQLAAIREGRADVLLNTTMNYIEDVRTIAHFAPKPFYFATARDGNKELLDQLDQAILNIHLSDYFFSARLHDKYFNAQENILYFTEEDKDYISNAGTVLVGVLNNQPPFYYQEDEGSQRGIIQDLLMLLSEKTGLQFQLVEADTVDALFQLVDEKAVELVACVPNDYRFGWEHHIALTRPYLTTQYTLIMREEVSRTGREGKRLALPMMSFYKGHTIGEKVIFETRSACVQAVNDGLADYTYVDICTAQYFMNQPQYGNLKMAPMSYEPLELSFGVPQPVDQKLLIILNKVIRNLSAEEIQGVVTKNTFMENRFSLSGYMRAHPVESIAVVSCILGLVIALLLLLLLQRMKNNRRIAIELRKRLRVYALTQDYFFEYDYQTGRIEVSYSAEDHKTKMKTEFYHSPEVIEDEAEDPDRVAFWKLMQAEESGIWECYQRCPDGVSHWLRVAVEVVHSKEGAPICAIGRITLIDTEKEEKNELEAKARFDGLTGVYNMKACREEIEACLIQMQEGDSGVFLLLDIDKFKSINDTFGHVQGDNTLCLLVWILKQIVRADDIIGRFGGDEFIVYLRNMDHKTLEIRYAILCQKIYDASRKDGNQPFTVSIGVAFASITSTYDSLFQAADMALYHAKAQGRNCYSVADGQTLMESFYNQYQEESAVSAVMHTDSDNQWLMDERYQMVLRATNTIAFEYDLKTEEEWHSPFVGEYIAGHYNGRKLSQVMLEDEVIHPEDRPLSLQFLARARKGENGEMTLRLLVPSGGYHWFRMLLTPYGSEAHRRLVGVLYDVDAETRQRNILRYQAEYDPVSGIYNKETFYERTKQLLENAPDEERFLLRFDIDRFKIINELYSIAEGDKVLRHVGQVLRHLTAEGELYARFSNDVFCACLNRSYTELMEFIAQLEQQVNQYPKPFQFVLSTGILYISHYQGEPINILCDRAAMAQQSVKGNYVKRYAFYEDAMSATLSREHAITGYMQQALDDGEFQVYFQPKFAMDSSAIIGAEALVRWYSSIEGMISPGDFIPLFERNGFILRLDEYVWDMTAQYMRRWIDEGIPLVPISLNVSRMHLYDPNFCGKISGISQKYQLSPALFELEITESAYTDEPEKLYGIMDRLQEEGFVFSMDDFGSGYSSLNILKDIPVDVVKIDLGFLKEARRGISAGRAVLDGTIRLVRGMGLKIIAEGVETQEQVEFLMNAGCMHAQGYYYARPMPAEEFRALLKTEQQKLVKHQSRDAKQQDEALEN